MTRRLHLVFLGSRLDLEIEAGADARAALEFVGTHYAARPEDEPELPEPLATLRLAAEADERHLPPEGSEAEEIHVRKSANEFFDIPARRAESRGRQYVHCLRTGTRFVFDPLRSRIEIALGREAHMDLVHLLRDLVLKHQENTGAAVLHASAAWRDGRAVLVTGAKGAGKSTVLLELVEHHGFRVLSGDKTVLRLGADGAVLAAGTPDYPHLGYATVAKYAGLAEIAGLAPGHRPPPGHEFSPYGKFAVDPVRFRRRFPDAPVGALAPVTAVLHPAIGPGERTELAPRRTDAAAEAEALRANLESAFDGVRWHACLDDERARVESERSAVLAALARIPSWDVSGPGDLASADLSEVIAEGMVAR